MTWGFWESMTKENFPSKKTLCVIITLVVLSTAASCSIINPLWGTTKIADLLASPSQYADSVVRVKGKVTNSFMVFGKGYFTVADETGSIAIIPSKTYPKTGEEVTIKGRLKSAFVIGDKSLTVLIENSQQ